MIVTDHPIMRDGLRLRVQQEADMCVVCNASNLSQTLRDFQTCRPDVVVIDLHLPQGAGVRAMNAITTMSPRTPLVVLADYPDEMDASPRAGVGATVIVAKMSASERVIPAIRQAISATYG
jgi:DNA-binding NarL/FixJ family response regulator